jgi:hypothetical protein
VLLLLQLLVAANGVPSSLMRSTLISEAIHSFETSVITRATRRHIENGILRQLLGHVIGVAYNLTPNRNEYQETSGRAE